MLVRDIMKTNPITVPSDTPITEARKIMKEHNVRRLPVVDNGKLVGIVTEDRLERISPKSTTPVLWQIHYLISHTTLKDIMKKQVVTVKPDATVEQAVATAQGAKVGILPVVEKGKLVGVVTTNDFFYKIVNPTLGLGEPGSRIHIPGGGNGQAAEKIIAAINRLDVGIKSIWTLNPVASDDKDIIVQVDTEDPGRIIEELQRQGFPASVRAR